MNTYLISALVLVAVLGNSNASFKCKGTIKDFNNEYSTPVCYDPLCTSKIENHIREELNAALIYLYIGAIFDQETVNRPGLAKFMYAAASEERQHAIMMLDYLNLRGIPHTEKYELLSDPPVKANLSYKEAMTLALSLEIDVTNYMYQIITACSDDFHAADLITDPMQAEQHESIRHLQGMIKEFDNLAQDTKDPHQLALAEYLFDKKLASGEITSPH